MKFLSDQEKALLRTQHKKERDGKVSDRIKAVLLFNKGWTPQQIAEALLTSEQAVHAGDLQSLLKVGNLRILNLKLKKVRAQKRLKHPTLSNQIDFAGILAVHEHIEDYNVSAKLNFKSRAPVEKLSKDLSKQLEVHLQERTYLYVRNMMAYVNNVEPAYGWIKKGVRKEIPANTEKARLNLSGVINVTNYNILIQEDQTLNADSTIQFFQKISKISRVNSRKLTAQYTPTANF